MVGENDTTTNNLQKEKLTGTIDILVPAGIELFLAGSGKPSTLPDDILSHPELTRESNFRRQLYQIFTDIYMQLPDFKTSLDEAGEDDGLDPKLVAKFYQTTADFLNRDPEHGRLILYLPVELLPVINTKHSKDQNLVSARSEFIHAYKTAWLRLLFESDVRALFVDGDVLEPGLGEPQRVRKAAHLLPFLLERGIVTSRDVLSLIKQSDEVELLAALMDGLTAAAGFVTNRRDIRKLIVYVEKKLAGRSVAGEFPLVSRINHAFIRDLKALPSKSFLVEFEEFINSQIRDLDERYADGSLQIKGYSSKRVAWEKQVKTDGIVDTSAREIARRVVVGRLEFEEIQALLSRSTSVITSAISMKSIMYIGEFLAKKQTVRARSFVDSIISELMDINQGQPSRAADQLVELLSHWRALGLIDAETAAQLGLTPPDLTATYPVDYRDLVSKSPLDFSAALEIISKHPVLKDTTYPFFLIFGSTIKGYAQYDADFDVAIFIKPSVPWQRRAEIIRSFRADVPQLQGIEKLLEYWVGEKDGRFSLRTPSVEIPTVVGAPEVHFLWGGIWAGRDRQMTDIRNAILNNYLNLDRFGENKEAVRFQLLRQLELDVLQVRLMHKGYRRFFPNSRSQGAAGFEAIDWDSDFWDPGYRRLASLLFISRVYLPELK